MPKAKIPFGPTYDEMLNPSHQDPQVRKQAEKALQENELDPINLFNITWKNSKDGTVNKIVLPKELTGVDANIVVLLGKYFPSGSHKVGPAYSTLIPQGSGRYDRAGHKVISEGEADRFRRHRVPFRGEGTSPEHV